MIGYLRGRLRAREAGRLLLDVNGVGYVVDSPLSTFLDLPADGAEVELLVNTQVREDSIALYGFRTAAEREIFERLIGVSGVGPRTALAALSALGPQTLAEAIRDGDARRLSSVPGIGKKTAERIIIDLRDRIGTLPPGGEARPRKASAGVEDDVLSALVNLGYPEKAASRAIADAVKGKGATTAPVFDQLLRASLAGLSRA